MAVFGDTLRQARAQLGVTLKEAEQLTHISRYYLLALEEERFDDLPALIHQRGFVRIYANYLRLDPNKLLSMFEETRGGSPDDPPWTAPAPPMEVPSRVIPNFAFLAFLVVMSAVVFAWTYSAYFAPNGAATMTTELIPTVTAVSGDSFVLPSPTPVPPTPTATATVEVIVEPTIPTDSALTDGSENATDPSNDAGVIDYVTPDAEPTEAPTGTLNLNFTATSDIESLHIAADGDVKFDGSLAAGESTGYINGDQFDVYVSDPASLEINKEGEEPFTMGGNSFQLP